MLIFVAAYPERHCFTKKRPAIVVAENKEQAGILLFKALDKFFCRDQDIPKIYKGAGDGYYPVKNMNYFEFTILTEEETNKTGARTPKVLLFDEGKGWLSF